MLSLPVRPTPYFVFSLATTCVTHTSLALPRLFAFGATRGPRPHQCQSRGTSALDQDGICQIQAHYRCGTNRTIAKQCRPWLEQLLVDQISAQRSQSGGGGPRVSWTCGKTSEESTREQPSSPVFKKGQPKQVAQVNMILLNVLFYCAASHRRREELEQTNADMSRKMRADAVRTIDGRVDTIEDAIRAESSNSRFRRC